MEHPVYHRFSNCGTRTLRRGVLSWQEGAVNGKTKLLKPTYKNFIVKYKLIVSLTSFNSSRMQGLKADMRLLCGTQSLGCSFLFRYLHFNEAKAETPISKMNELHVFIKLIV